MGTLPLTLGIATGNVSSLCVQQQHTEVCTFRRARGGVELRYFSRSIGGNVCKLRPWSMCTEHTGPMQSEHYLQAVPDRQRHFETATEDGMISRGNVVTAKRSDVTGRRVRQAVEKSTFDLMDFSSFFYFYPVDPILPGISYCSHAGNARASWLMPHESYRYNIHTHTHTRKYKLFIHVHTHFYMSTDTR